MEYLRFAFQSFWNFVGFAFLFYVLMHYGVNLLIRIISRTYRMIMVLARGWPPQHLDADGDWKVIQTNEEINP